MRRIRPGGSPTRAASASRRRLQDIAHGGPVEQNLMFAGHAAFRFKIRPILLERLRPDGQAARRPDSDGGVRMKRGLFIAALLCFATVASGAGQDAALLGVDRQRRGDDAHRAGAQLSRRVAVQAPRPADPRGPGLSQLAQDRGSRRPAGLDAGDAAQRSPHRAGQAGRAARHSRRARGQRPVATAPKPASSGGSSNATGHGATSKSASAQGFIAQADLWGTSDGETID